MTISNKIAMDIAVANMDTATACPDWMFIVFGTMALILVGGLVALFVANK